MSLFQNRSTWNSNFSYILAAIGCAAGLGNLWRFPMLAYENGGAAFIIALLISNLFIVYPLLLSESVIGQKFRLAAPQSFEKFSKNTSWIQWIAVFSIFGILTYYTPIMAWGLTYMAHIFNPEFLANPSGYFTENIIQLTDNITDMGTFQFPILFAVLIGYALVLFALRKNVQTLSSVVKVTAIAPFILLFIMMIRGVTLPGAADGLALFLIPDWGSLFNIQLWQAAISQSFFSASVAMAYFILAASHRKKDEELPLSSLWILGGNFLVSLLSGLAVFSTLGFMAQSQGVGVSEVSQGGPMLIFSVLPTAISLMPTGVLFFALLLFIIFFFLAIDSIFGLLEAITGSFNDLFGGEEKTYFSLLLRVVGVAMLLSLPYLFGAGLYYLDIVDHFISGFMLLLVGILESYVIAYKVGASTVRHWINDHARSFKIPALFDSLMKLTPIILSLLFIATLYKETQEWYGGYPKEYIIFLGFGSIVLILFCSWLFFFLGRKKLNA